MTKVIKKLKIFLAWKRFCYLAEKGILYIIISNI